MFKAMIRGLSVGSSELKKFEVPRIASAILFFRHRQVARNLEARDEDRQGETTALILHNISLKLSAAVQSQDLLLPSCRLHSFSTRRRNRGSVT
jgi:hypothetical protein